MTALAPEPVRSDAGPAAVARPDSSAAAPLACVHCGLPVPSPRSGFEGEAARFCCTGCEAVHALLLESGLERYYDLRERFDTGPLERPGARTYAAFDDPTFHALHVRRRGEALAEIDIAVTGLRCVACAWLLERLPRLVRGVLRADVDAGAGTMRLAFDPSRPLSEIAAAIDALGYPVHPRRGAERAQARRREDRALLVRLGVAGAAAGNVMLVSMALYGGLFSDMAPGEARLFRWLSLAICAPAVLGAGSIFFRGALTALRARTLHLDQPIALGLAVGLVWGAVNTLLDRGEVWFDSLAVLTTLLLLGRYLAQTGRRRAVDATELIDSLAPLSARRVGASGIEEVPLEALLPGDEVLVRPGDAIPADGLVLEGESSLDAAFLTGEARPVAARAGDEVPAGALNLTAPLRLRALRTGEETRAGRLSRLVDDLAARKAPVSLLVDGIAGWFVGGVLALALVCVLVWGMARGRWEDGLENALALLVVTCPCALGMATPLAFHAALGHAARGGIYARGGDVLQALGDAEAGRIWLDKTGTLTEGKARLLSCARAPDVTADEQEALITRVAALESRSSHALARALEAERPAACTVEAPEEVRERPGGGIEGRVRGHFIRVGTLAFVSEAAAVPAELMSAAADAAMRGETPVLVAEDGRARLALGLGDALRPDAAAFVAALRERGFRVGLLSGDDPVVVQRVAATVGIAPEDAIGGASPERKAGVVAASVEALRARPRAPVVMLGDGVNDAPAFAAATVGIAVHGATERGVAAASAFLVRPGLAAVLDLVDGSRRAMRVVRRNLAFSLAYNVVGATLAVTGLLHPLAGAVLMPASSLTVVLSSYRARTFARPRGDANPTGLFRS